MPKRKSKTFRFVSSEKISKHPSTQNISEETLDEPPADWSSSMSPIQSPTVRSSLPHSPQESPSNINNSTHLSTISRGTRSPVHKKSRIQQEHPLEGSDISLKNLFVSNNNNNNNGNNHDVSIASHRHPTLSSVNLSIEFCSNVNSDLMK